MSQENCIARYPVFLFHGANGRTCVAAFSSLETASEWIKEHELSGILLRYTVDEPSFDRLASDRELPRYIDQSDPRSRELFVDNRYHWHFMLGVREDEPGFEKEADRWEWDNVI